MPVTICQVCGYIIANPSNPCPSCGNKVQPNVTYQPIFPFQLIKTTQDDAVQMSAMTEAFIMVIAAYLKMWGNGFNFFGRTRRRDYWLASLVHIVILFVLGLYPHIHDIIYLLYLLVSIIPFTAMRVRRAHDVGIGGWAIIGDARPDFNDSVPDNEYGPNPKEMELDIQLELPLPVRKDRLDAIIGILGCALALWNFWSFDFGLYK